MKIEGEAKRITIYIGESDQWHGKPLYSAIVEEARRYGMAGATVIRGVEGFGAHSRIHTAKILKLSEDLPMMIIIVDVEERANAFLPILHDMVHEGMVTVEDLHIIKYVAGTA